MLGIGIPLPGSGVAQSDILSKDEIVEFMNDGAVGDIALRMSDYLLGIDYSTGGAKATIIHVEGDVLGFAFREYPFYHDHPGWSEHDAMGYWTVCCEMIHECVERQKG